MEWISVKDSLPELDDTVFLCLSKFGSKGYYRFASGYLNSDTNTWWIINEDFGEIDFEESSEYQNDYMLITHYIIPELPL